MTADHKFTILVVDDSRLQRALLNDTLGESGYHVIVAEDGVEGLKILREQKVDLIISDVEMPKLDGMEFCRAVKHDEKLKDIYFIMFTVREDIKDKIEGLNIGADDYITKSTFETELIARVNAGTRIKRLEEELKEAQFHLFQSDKMASVGQLAAGVAHEINNPIGFISSNLRTLGKYVAKMTDFIQAQSEIREATNVQEALDAIRQKRDDLKLDYIVTDIKDLIKDSLEGAERVKRIVQDLKSFSRVDETEYKLSDINAGLESAVNMAIHELKYKATLKKEYGDIPSTMCNLGQLNQVFLNLLVNAAHAIEKQGEVTIKTWNNGGYIYVTISDTGSGIPEANLKKIFEPFFTTKEVGKGTGLGLSIVYDIIKKHMGEIKVESAPGKGATFTIKLPVVEA